MVYQAIGTAPSIVSSVKFEEQDAMMVLGNEMHRSTSTIIIAENSKMLKTNMMVESMPRPLNYNDTCQLKVVSSTALT